MALAHLMLQPRLIRHLFESIGIIRDQQLCPHRFL
jgi:hypothetical protein